jgi:hypothetical protein
MLTVALPVLDPTVTDCAAFGFRTDNETTEIAAEVRLWTIKFGITTLLPEAGTVSTETFPADRCSVEFVSIEAVNAVMPRWRRKLTVREADAIRTMDTFSDTDRTVATASCDEFDPTSSVLHSTCPLTDANAVRTADVTLRDPSLRRVACGVRVMFDIKIDKCRVPF